MKTKNWAMKRSYDGQNKRINQYDYKYDSQPVMASGSQYRSQYPPHYYPVPSPQQLNALHYNQMIQNANMYNSPPSLWSMRPPLAAHSSQQLPYNQSIHAPPRRLSMTSAGHSSLDPSTSSHNSGPMANEPYPRTHTPPAHQTFSTYPSESTLMSRSRQNPSRIQSPLSQPSFSGTPQSPFSGASQSPCESYTSESLDMNTSYGVKAKSVSHSVKKKKVASENTTSKEWRRQDALKAVALEERFCKRNSNAPTLILRFPDPQLDRDIVKGFSPSIEGVHFQQNSAPRFCFVRLKSDADVEKTIEELSNIPFGAGFIKAEQRRVVTNNPSSTTIERVDPYSLYIGNLPRTVSVANVKESFPGAQRYDVGHSQKTWPAQYAFVRYRSAADAMQAFTQTVNKTIDSRSLVIRFRRTKNSFVPEVPLSKDDLALIDKVVNAEVEKFEEILQLKQSDIGIDPVTTENITTATSSSNRSNGTNLNTSSTVAKPTADDGDNCHLSNENSEGTSSVAAAQSVDQTNVKQEPNEEEDLSANGVRIPTPVKEEKDDVDDKFAEVERFDRYASNSLFTVREKRSEIKSEFDDDSYDDDFMYESDEDFGSAIDSMAKKSNASVNLLQPETRFRNSFELGEQSIETDSAAKECVLSKNADHINKIDTIFESSTEDTPPRKQVYENSFVTSVVRHLTGVKEEDENAAVGDIRSGVNMTFSNKILSDLSDEMDSGGEVHSDSEFEDVNSRSSYKDAENNIKMTIKEE